MCLFKDASEARTHNTLVSSQDLYHWVRPGLNIALKPWVRPGLMKKVNKQCLLDTPRTVRVREKTCQVIVQTSRL